MGNHSDQFKKGSIVDRDSDVSGAAGAFKTKQCGELSYPCDTSHGIRLWEEGDSIVNEQCAYVLLALGRASCEKGLSLSMPPWGTDCQAAFPNGPSRSFLTTWTKPEWLLGNGTFEDTFAVFMGCSKEAEALKGRIAEAKAKKEEERRLRALAATVAKAGKQPEKKQRMLSTDPYAMKE